MSGNSAVVGPMGIRAIGEGGFDINSKGTALAVLNSTVEEGFNSPNVPQGTTRDTAFRLYVLSLTNGQASKMGEVQPMIGMAIP